MSITEVAIKRPLLITVIFTTLILFGFISYKQLNYNLLPKFEANVIMVQTTYRGASPEEIQNTLTKPIEDAVSAIEGVDQIASTSMEGVSAITVTLKSGTDVNNAQRDAERRIDMIRSTLPDDSDDPVVRRFSTDEIPILRMSISSDLSPGDLYEQLDKRVAPIISNVSGVGSVTLIGAQQREVQVVMDNDKLKAYGIGSGQVAQAVAANSSTFPAGNVAWIWSMRRSASRWASFTLVPDLSVTVMAETPSMLVLAIWSTPSIALTASSIGLVSVFWISSGDAPR